MTHHHTLVSVIHFVVFMLQEEAPAIAVNTLVLQESSWHVLQEIRLACAVQSCERTCMCILKSRTQSPRHVELTGTHARRNTNTGVFATLKRLGPWSKSPAQNRGFCAEARAENRGVADALLSSARPPAPNKKGGQSGDGFIAERKSSQITHSLEMETRKIK